MFVTSLNNTMTIKNMEMKLPDIFYMLGVIFYSAIAGVVAEIYERRLTARQEGRIHLKDIVLILGWNFLDSSFACHYAVESNLSKNIIKNWR